MIHPLLIQERFDSIFNDNQAKSFDLFLKDNVNVAKLIAQGKMIVASNDRTWIVCSADMPLYEILVSLNNCAAQ